MSSPPNETVDVESRDAPVEAPIRTDSETIRPVPAAGSTPARGSLYQRMVGAAFVCVFVSSLGVTFGAFRACITAPVVAAVAITWESYVSHSLPPLGYTTHFLLQYIQAGAFGACAFSIPLGIAAAAFIPVGGSTRSSRTYITLKERYKQYKAQRAAANHQPDFRLKKLALKGSAMAITASLVPAGVLVFQWWYGSGMELLVENRRRVLALAVLADVLASVVMKWRRSARKASGDSRPSADGGKEPALEVVVVDVPKE